VYGDVGAAVVDAGAEYEEEAKRSLEEKVGQHEEELAGITIEQVVRQGRAATVLVEEASDAELLVVGSRGHGGFVGMLIGSVSNECARHAPCPVVIVPSAESEE
jgi:nucleotide-binding universal stress UspA family protein